MDNKYRIVRLRFPWIPEYRYEVQVQYWRQVCRRHRFETLEEAKKRIEQLKTLKDRKQEVIYEE